MGRVCKPKPCCSYVGLSKGPWTHEEDLRLIKYIEAHGEGNWRTLPMKAGLLRCGKGCRSRWVNYLRPNVKRGHISPDEEDMIIRLHKLLGNRWSLIAGRIPGRTDNEVKNYWNIHLRKKSNATTGFTLNARALRGKKPGFELVAPDKKLCRGTINPLCMNENDSSFSPHKDTSSTGHAVKDENSGSACWDIPGIASFLMLDDDLCSRTDYVAIENFKQSIDEFHDTYMDLNTSTINNMHTAWPHENHHPSPMPMIYLPEFDPYKTCPSECMVAGGLYQQYSMSGSFTSMGQQVDNIASENISYRENPTGEVSDLQSKTAGEAQIQVHVPPYGLIHEDNSTAIGCDLFDQCSINTSLLSCLQSEDRTTSQWSETWLSSFDWFDRI